MKLLLLNIKNSLPYLILVLIYFFFVNLEARNDLNSFPGNSKITGKIKESINDRSEIKNTSITISIPIYPYNQ